MSLQACLFDINDWSTDEARKFLKIHNITPIKKVTRGASPLVGRAYIKQKHFYDIESFSQITINIFIALKLYRKNH